MGSELDDVGGLNFFKNDAIDMGGGHVLSKLRASRNLGDACDPVGGFLGLC